MYEEFYGLNGRPFQLTPDHRFFFESSVHRKAASYLLYGLGQGEGFIVITGEVGAGKTTLLRHLLSTLNPREYTTAEIVTSQLGAEDVLRMVAKAFGIRLGNADKARVLADIEDFLMANHRRHRRCLLVVDEAQNLSVAALEELRMLSNLQDGSRSPLQSFLVGQPQFRRALSGANLTQLRQRVIASYHLGPMDEAETAEYVRHRLKMVGWAGDPAFSEDCMAAIHRHTQGVPRRINTLVSRLLLYGCLEELHTYDGGMVDAVATELAAETAAPPGEPPGDIPADTSREPAAAPSSAPLPTGHELTRRLEALEERCDRHDRALHELVQLFTGHTARHWTGANE